jgi:uncharacterized protein YraI
MALFAVTLVISTLSAVFLAPPEGALAAPANTTDWLNLRSGPGVDYSVILVMEPGAYVEIVQNVQNGYYRVYYNGTSGWAAAAYLDRSGSGGGGGSTSDGGGGGGGGSATVTSALNLRSGPSTGNSVLAVMPSGATVSLNGDSSNGFISVSYQGMSGWAYADFLNSGGGGGGSWSADSSGSGTVVGSAVTTSALNLRSGPGTGNSVLTVMPSGASVNITGDPQNGFYPLSYGGMNGWASGDYLSSGGGGGGATSGGSGDDIVSIIYAAADRYGQSRADMLRVAQCESGLDPNQVTSPYQASGLFQFLPGTWATTPYADQYILDPWANANAAAWMWSVGRRGEWVCQ